MYIFVFRVTFGVWESHCCMCFLVVLPYPQTEGSGLWPRQSSAPTLLFYPIAGITVSLSL